MHRNAFLLPLGAALVLSLGGLGCTDIDPCPKPAATRSCTCRGGVPGTQTCLPEKVWDDCACGGDDGGVGTGGGGGGSGGAGQSGGAGAGTGGVPPVPAGAGAGTGGAGTGGSGTGGSAAGTDGGDIPTTDGGLEPVAGAGSDAGSAGAGTGGSGPGPDAYRTCTVEDGCGDGSTCLTLTDAFPPTDAFVCAQDCGAPDDCPVPAGSYEAMVVCEANLCRLDCTGTDLLSTPLSCPSGLSCQTEDLISGASYCYH